MSLFDNGAVFEIMENCIFERRAMNFGFSKIPILLKDRLFLFFFNCKRNFHFFPSFFVIEIQKKKKIVLEPLYVAQHFISIIRYLYYEASTFSNEL